MESTGVPGMIQIAESTWQLCRDRYPVHAARRRREGQGADAHLPARSGFCSPRSVTRHVGQSADDCRARGGSPRGRRGWTRVCAARPALALPRPRSTTNDPGGWGADAADRLRRCSQRNDLERRAEPRASSWRLVARRGTFCGPGRRDRRSRAVNGAWSMRSARERSSPRNLGRRGGRRRPVGPGTFLAEESSGARGGRRLGRR